MFTEQESLQDTSQMRPRRAVFASPTALKRPNQDVPTDFECLDEPLSVHLFTNKNLEARQESPTYVFTNNIEFSAQTFPSENNISQLEDCQKPKCETLHREPVLNLTFKKKSKCALALSKDPDKYKKCDYV